MLLPTLEDVLALPALRTGDPQVRAGARNLDRRVRWVHVSEVSDIASLLEGGELILTTGIALPDSAPALARYVDELNSVGVTALAVELGRRYRGSLPAALVDVAERTGLPLIELRREVPFVAVTQAVHTLILDARMQELIASDAAHNAFTELTVAGHGPQQVVDLVASMAERPVIYENLVHQVLAYNGAGVEAGVVLEEWESRARAAHIAGDAHEMTGWLTVSVAPPGGGGWGRLIMLCDAAPSPRERMLLERGATALVINRLTVRDIDSLERQSHRTLLTALALSTELPSETGARAKALGVPLERRSLTGVVVRPAATLDDPGALPALLRDIASQAVATLQGLKIPALVGPLDDQRVAVLLSQERTASADAALKTLSDRLHAVSDRRAHTSLIVGTGSTVVGLERAQHTLREAMQVADTALGLPAQRGFFRPPDLRLRGLVYSLRGEPLVHDYVGRELGQLLAHDAAHGTRLYEFLAAYCRNGGNKTAAAAQLFISRPALYDRIAKVERLLDVDLADPEIVLALHFAVLARETMRSPNLAVVTG
ncbi:MAG TPA: PucR family transcriptional regulator ligand-binding domain-containing protein [Jatrophihabitans sp.]|jgi:purine catabolism regulator|nr:PucR family transcriptional regulator ligand-binding domain-containing protein [Jatrophihabitans sp.]